MSLLVSLHYHSRPVQRLYSISPLQASSLYPSPSLSHQIMSSSSSFSPQMMDHSQLALELTGIENRSRSSTWPCPPDDEDMGGRGHSESPVPNITGPSGSLGGGIAGGVGKPDSAKKMRNAWGNMSYADLITQAILSSQDKRLTLSEIYDWIVQNVPYFSDKASSPSTAGWKVREI